MVNLLQGESLVLDSRLFQTPSTLPDAKLNEKYAGGAVRIVTEQARYPLTAIQAMVEGNDYELNPEFQRRHRWNAQKQSRLIESFIINVPIPPIFLYEVGYAQYEVMDGLQRLTAITDFYRDQLVLTGLEEWPELNGRTYSTLPEQIRRGVDRRYLSSIILLQETAKSSKEAQRLKQLVFERINSGGVKLEPQESRNAIYNGPLNKLCIKLARNPFLCRMWGIPEPSPKELSTHEIPQTLLENRDYQKMTDVELVLRFFAYRQRLKHHSGALRDYHDEFLKYGNLFSDTLLSKLEVLFEETIEFVYNLLGNRAFWLYRKRDSRWIWYQRPTIVVYDPLMLVASNYLGSKDEVIARKTALKSAIKQLYIDNYEDFQGRYTNKLHIETRHALFTDLFEKVLAK